MPPFLCFIEVKKVILGVRKDKFFITVKLLGAVAEGAASIL